MTLEEKKKFLRNYRWSSYGSYLSGSARKNFLEVNEVLAHFGGDTPKGRRKYEDFVMAGLSGKIPSPLEKGKGHGIVGANEFIEKIKEQFIQFDTTPRELPAVKKILAQVEPERIIRATCETFRAEKEELLGKGYKGVARGVLMDMLYRYGGMNQREIGELMNIDYSAVSVARKRLSVLQRKDRNLAWRTEKIKKQIQSSQE
jgi:hypothetical protein